MRKTQISFIISIILFLAIACGEKSDNPPSVKPPASQPSGLGPAAAPSITAFGEGGQIKMLCDRRQRPQSVYLNGKVHLVFNGGGEPGATPKARTKPMAVTYDTATRKFSEVVTLEDGLGSSDHHHGPVIWADTDNYLHILYGCHSSPGTHLISKKPASIGASLDDWDEGPQIAPSLSYPTFHCMAGGKQLVYYRTLGHISSWTYRVSEDKGQTWAGPAEAVTDMDVNGRFEWSSYQCTLPAKDGKSLHVAFMTYDDNRDDEPKRYYNPRYDREVTNDWKYNLYYVNVDPFTHTVKNFEGEVMKTPIDIDNADANCRIWDTEGRGAGVPPTLILDENGDPAFLHVLSEDTLEDHNYYYVRRSGGEWKKTPITHSSHQWNSCHLTRDAQGTLHAYLIVGEGYFDTDGYMDRYGGGDVEEWISTDKGDTWSKRRDLTPDRSKYPGWRYNNVQPVVKADGIFVDDMLLFYGWQHKDAPEAKAFLWHGLPAHVIKGP